MNDSRNFISTNNTGVVLSFNKDRGFGFIKVDNDGSHVFVHIRDIDTNPADYPEAGYIDHRAHLPRFSPSVSIEVGLNRGNVNYYMNNILKGV